MNLTTAVFVTLAVMLAYWIGQADKIGVAVAGGALGGALFMHLAHYLSPRQ